MIKLISLNIEGDNHLDKAVNFLKREKADVVCLQEVFQRDVPLLEQSLEMYGEYAPSMLVREENDSRLSPRGSWGLLFLSRDRPVEINRYYYVGSEDDLPVYANDDPNSNNRILLVGKVIRTGQDFTIATTHFTWSDKGQVTEEQRMDLFALFNAFTEKYITECVFCGDFNAPRGGEIFSEISKRFKDNIPADILTTLDPDLHKFKNLQWVVDGFFSTPKYIISDVRVVDGVSDHKAIVCLITKS